jgi:hypothetical protein
VAGLWLNRPRDGKAAPFCGRKNSTEIRHLGGGLAIAKLHPAGLIQLFHPLNIFKHTTINQLVDGFGLNWLGDGKAAPF